MEGLTDRQQALVLLISSLLISVGALDPLMFGETTRLFLVVLGSIGFGLKEWIGGKKS